jgi:hypothetical protein
VAKNSKGESAPNGKSNGANLGFEAALWQAEDRMLSFLYLIPLLNFG